MISHRRTKLNHVSTIFILGDGGVYFFSIFKDAAAHYHILTFIKFQQCTKGNVKHTTWQDRFWHD